MRRCCHSAPADYNPTDVHTARSRVHLRVATHMPRRFVAALCWFVDLPAPSAAAAAMRRFFQAGIVDRTAYGVARRAVGHASSWRRDVGSIMTTRRHSAACGAVDFSLFIWASRPAGEAARDGVCQPLVYVITRLLVLFIYPYHYTTGRRLNITLPITSRGQRA